MARIILRLAQDRLEHGDRLFAQQAVGILALRDARDADLQVFLEQHIDRFLRGVLTGAVRVEADDDFFPRDSLENARM